MMTLEIQVLGVGGGVSKVLHNHASTSWVLLIDNTPAILFDIGLGVTFEYTKLYAALPSRVYISHNHSDHSGELPVLLAVQKAKKVAVEIISNSVIIDRLVKYRLHELQSTGISTTDFFTQVTVTQEHFTEVLDGLSIRTVKSKHSETCYGMILCYKNKLLIGWSADSGFDKDLYDELFAAEHVILDARVNGSAEHAGFDEIQSYIHDNGFHSKNIIVLGYGEKHVNSDSYTVGVSGEKYVVYDGKTDNQKPF